MAEFLRRSGYQVREIADGPWDWKQENVLLVLGNLNWFPKLKKQLLKHGRPADSLVAIWHYEPLPPPRSSGQRWPAPTPREVATIILRDRRATDIRTNYFLLRRLARQGLPDILAVSTRARAEFLAEHGIRAHYVPLGYMPVFGRDLGSARDVDVLFLGDCWFPRRRRILARLHKRGVNLTVRGDFKDPALWGERRTELLNRTKIFLNILKLPTEFSGLRFILGMANGALVISEPVSDSFPFVAGRHFISATAEDLPGAIRYYLENESERRRIADEAYEFVTQQLSMERSVAQLVELIGAPVAV